MLRPSARLRTDIWREEHGWRLSRAHTMPPVRRHGASGVVGP
jgi:hypothetical protein